MRRLSVFNSVSVDGYFRTTDGDIDWLKGPQGDDPEFKQFISGNASGESVLLFGRKTYDMMAAFWPTPEAAAQFPEVAKGMAKATRRRIVRADYSAMLTRSRARRRPAAA